MVFLDELVEFRVVDDVGRCSIWSAGRGVSGGVHGGTGVFPSRLVGVQIDTSTRRLRCFLRS